MASAAQPKSAFEMILAWSANRPGWQRDALRRIVANGRVLPEEISELAGLCKKGRGAPDIESDPIVLAAEHLPAATTAGNSVRLSSISDVVGVNMLGPAQSLPFVEQGITVIYGDNGTGKSGYGRILKKACRARFQGEILANAYDPGAAGPAMATITFTEGDGPPTRGAWINDGSSHDILSAVSVFDRDCGTVHIREKNTVAFRPFGLDIPDELASVCQAVKEALTNEQTALTGAQDTAFAEPRFSPTSAVGQVLGKLSPKTDLAPLRALAVLEDAERERLQRLNEDLSGDPLKASAEQKAWSVALNRLADDLTRVLTETDDVALNGLMGLGKTSKEARIAATLAAELAFGRAAVRGVGEPAWRAMWEAARRYSVSTPEPDLAFPPVEDDARCVLCHQPLTADARSRMAGFDAFVKADTEQRADAADRALTAARREIESRTIKMQSFALRPQLAVSHARLAKDVLTSLACARLRRAQALAAASIGEERILSPFRENPVTAIRAAAAAALAYSLELAAAADLEGRARLERERDGLRDRAMLEDLLPKAVVEIQRLEALERLSKCLGETSTNAVTKLGSDLADEVVTPRVRDRFQAEIQKLAASRVRVEIVRSGGKFGSPQYQIRLFANDKAKVHSILSEGEQTCVALAAFLTELATAGHNSALVFDDPVSSLDHRWRLKVAERLVEEAATRQIIVFTHDLIFLNDIQSLATERGIEHGAVSISQTKVGAGIVSPGLPWAGAGVKQRIDELEKDVRAAKLLFEARDDEAYAVAASGIYSRLRSTWERGLEDIAFCDVVQRHRDYIKTKDLLKVTVLDAPAVEGFRKGFKKCCDQTEAHDPSRGRNASPPPPDEIMQDVQDMKLWSEGLRAAQRHVA
jgi:hypothetical protein